MREADADEGSAIVPRREPPNMGIKDRDPI